MNKISVALTFLLLLFITSLFPQVMSLSYCEKPQGSTCLRCIQGYHLKDSQCVHLERNLQTTNIQANLSQTNNSSSELSGVSASSVEVRSKADGSEVNPLSITTLNVDGQVGNFFSINVGDDPTKVQLVLDSLTQLSQQTAENRTTQNNQTQNEGQTKKQSVNESENKQVEDPSLIQATKESKESLNLVPAQKNQKIDLTQVQKQQNKQNQVDLIQANKVNNQNENIQFTQVNKKDENQTPLELTPASKQQNNQQPIGLTQASKQTPIQLTPASNQTPLDLQPALKQQNNENPIDLTPASKQQNENVPLNLTPASKQQDNQAPLELTPASKQTPLDLTPVEKKQDNENPLDLTPASKSIVINLTSVPKKQNGQNNLDLTPTSHVSSSDLKQTQQKATFKLTQVEKQKTTQDLSLQNIQFTKSRRVKLVDLVAVLRKSSGRTPENKEQSIKCTNDFTIYQLPDEKLPKGQTSKAIKFIQSTLGSVGQQCVDFYDASSEYLCYDPVMNIAYQSALRNFPSKVKGFPILKAYYDFCCSGIGQNIRFFLIDDSKFPQITIYRSSVVVDRIRKMAFPVDAVEYSRSTNKN